MNNFELTICWDSGDEVELDFDSMADLIAWMAGPEAVAEAEGVVIEAQTDDGHRVVMMINRDAATVTAQVYDPPRELAA